MDLIRIAALGIAGGICALLIRQRAPVFGICISLAIGLIIFWYMLLRIEVLFSYIEALPQYSKEGNRYMQLLFKACGITLLTEFAAGMCKECGLQACSTLIQMVAKVSLMLLGLPILSTLFHMMGGILG